MIRKHAALIVLSLMWLCAGTAHAGQATIESHLSEVIKGRALGKSVEITYTDMHGLWGGLRISVRGDGKVDQEAVRQKVPKASNLSREAVRELIELVVSLKAWEQVTANRPAVLDESRSYLKIKVNDQNSEIWEWSNDLKKNNRILQIRDFMQRHAWKVAR